MKKTLTLIFMTCLGFSSSAQYFNLRVDTILSPTELHTYEDGATIKTDWNVDVVVTNLGPDAIQAGDSMLWAVRLVDKVANTVKADLPGGGKWYLWNMNRTVNPNDTIHFTRNITLTGGLSQSKNFIMYFFTQAYTGSDTITTNNTGIKELVWYNINGWNVGLNDIQYYNNIATYPNPASDQLFISLLEVNLKEVKVEFFNLSGQAVWSSVEHQDFLNGGVSINTAELENGLYILKVEDGPKVSSTKVAIQH